MKPTQKHVPKRSSDQDRITISLPKSLLARIDQEAARENRTRSNWINTRLGEIIENMGLRSMEPPADEGKGKKAK